MNAILKKIRNVIGAGTEPQLPQRAAAAVENTWVMMEFTYDELVSNPGDFTLFITGDAASAMKEVAGLEIEKLKPIPGRILAKCKELGFWHKEPTDFLFNVQNVSREVCWTVTRIVPPMILSGKTVAKSVTVFLPTIREEVSEMKRNILWVGHVKGWFGSDSKERQFSKISAATIRAKYKTIFAHELVHIFATDEYKPIMKVLGLDLLELLTDSIVMATYYGDYKGSDSLVKAGFMDGLGYMVKLMNGERPKVTDPAQMFELAYQRAKRIITECQELVAAAAMPQDPPSV